MSEAAWLEELEAAVRRAADSLTRLRTEKRELAERVECLEEELAAVGGDDPPEAEAWEEEREEVRERVERLVEGLERLLDDE